MEKRVPGTGDVWGFYESRRLVPLIPSRPRKPCPSFLWEAGSRYLACTATVKMLCRRYDIPACSSLDGQLEGPHQARAGGEGTLPTADGVAIRPPDARIAARWHAYNIAQQRRPENTDAAPSPPRLM